MTTALLIVFIAASATLAIRSRYNSQTQQHYLFKPLTTGLILLLALQQSGDDILGLYALLVLLGIGFSLQGDVWLMLPDDRFVQGLGSFLVAHLLYSVAFASRLDGAPPLVAIVLVAGVAAGMVQVLWPHLGHYRWPVMAYIGVIAVMGGLAISVGLQAATQAAVLGAVGAALFMLSDAVLAYNRFVLPLPPAQLIILGTYYAAQTCIALSI